MSKIKNQALAQDGNKLLDWAAGRMPVLAKIRKRFEDEKPLSKLTIGIALHLEKKTGILLRTLAAGGAKVTAASCNPLTTDDSVAAALTKEMDVFAWAGQTDSEYYVCLESVITAKPHITIDDGCDLIQLLHSKHSNLLDHLIGGCEETTTGIVRLEAMHKDGALKVPVMAVNNAHSKYLFDNSIPNPDLFSSNSIKIAKTASWPSIA